MAWRSAYPRWDLLMVLQKGLRWAWQKASPKELRRVSRTAYLPMEKHSAWHLESLTAMPFPLMYIDRLLYPNRNLLAMQMELRSA